MVNGFWILHLVVVLVVVSEWGWVRLGLGYDSNG